MHHRRFVTLVMVLTCLLIVPVSARHATLETEATPFASPVASPVVDDDCSGLERYFLELAALVQTDAGLETMRSVGFDSLALSNEEAAAVVTDLNLLLPAVSALSVPPAAMIYHEAYLAMLTWYRDLAEFRDPASHQRLINNDRYLFGDIGVGVQQGQIACGFERWNDAYDHAFPS